MLKQRAAQDAEEKNEIDQRIAEQVQESNLYRQSACVFCYVSTSQEIDTHKILRHALAAGKTVCVPLCGAQGEMSARRIRSLDELHTGAYGILEPDAAAEEIVPAQIDLVIAPALACDRQGFRLGYGGGFYDRFLEKHKGIKRVAAAFEFQMFEEVPTEPTDISPEIVVTEKEILRF